MHIKKLGIAILAFAFFSCISFLSCSKEGGTPANCNELETKADSVLAHYYRSPTKSACDSARSALSEAADCDDSYKNEYDAFPSCQ